VTGARTGRVTAAAAASGDGAGVWMRAPDGGAVGGKVGSCCVGAGMEPAKGGARVSIGESCSVVAGTVVVVVVVVKVVEVAGTAGSGRDS